MAMALPNRLRLRIVPSLFLAVTTAALAIVVPATQGESSLPFGAICGLGVSALSVQHCVDEFKSGIEPYTVSQTRPDGTNEIGTLSFAVCCQINKFEACISRKISSICGDDTGSAAKTVMKATIEGTNFLTGGELDCVGYWYYEPESPLCWSPVAQIAGAVGLVIILVTACCCCCCRLCCGCCRKSKSAAAGPTVIHMIQPPMPMPGTRHFASIGRPGQVPYQQMRNETA